MSNPYQTPPPDPYGGAQPPYGAPGYGGQQPGYGGAQSPYGQQQPPVGYGYPQQPPLYAPAPPAAEPNSLATASTVLGFVSVIVCFYGGLLAPVGLGIGIAALNRSAKTGVGRTAAIGGIVLNVLAILIAIAGLVFYFVLQKQTGL